MASQFVLSQQIKWIGATLPAFVRLAALLGRGQETLCPFTFLGEAVTQALGLLPAVVAVLSPVLLSLLVDPYCVLLCVLRLLVSCWSLLHLLTQLV